MIFNIVRLFLKCHICCFCTTWERQLGGVSAHLWDQSNKYYWVSRGLKNSLNRVGFLICTTIIVFNGCPYFFDSHGIHKYAIIVFLSLISFPFHKASLKQLYCSWTSITTVWFSRLLPRIEGIKPKPCWWTKNFHKTINCG